MEVNDLIKGMGEAVVHEWKFVLWPKLWEEYLEKSQPNFNWEIFPFSRECVDSIPNVKGIYTLRVKY